MQLLMEGSEESPDAGGFGVFRGRCRRFEHGKVPQIGWNELQSTLPLPLFSGIADGTFFYFIHGFYVPPFSGPGVAAETDYHLRYPSVLASGNLTGVQFHPEKSGEAGLRLLRNWIERC
jgi:glutamine amidotransferase